MPYSPGERFNPQVAAFHALASAGLTPYHSPGLRAYELLIEDSDRLTSRAEEAIEEVVELFPVGWDSSDFSPRVPRETVGFHADGSPVSDPDGPFDSDAALPFRLTETIEPR